MRAAPVGIGLQNAALDRRPRMRTPLVRECKDQHRLTTVTWVVRQGIHGDVLVSVGAAIAEGLLELSVPGAIRPESPTGARIECLEPAVARTVENQSPGCDQSACRGRQRLGHAPNDASADGIPGTELALPRRDRGQVRSGGGR